MSTVGDVIRWVGSGFVDFPGSRVLCFGLGVSFLATHGLAWSWVVTGSKEFQEQNGTTWSILVLSGLFGVFFLVGAFGPRGRAGAYGPGSGIDGDPAEALDRDAVATPAGVPTDPLTCYLSGTAMHRVRRLREGVLVIDVPPVMEVILIASGVLVSFLCLVNYREVSDFPISAVLMGPAFVALGGLLWSGHRRNVFDLGRGTFRRSDVLGWGRTLPLSKVRAVQLLTEVPREAKVDDKRTERYAAYQLNLVLHDPDRPRRLLLEDRDRDSTVRIARELAGFLGLPLYRTHIGLKKTEPEL